jgi:hypothetical protein
MQVNRIVHFKSTEDVNENSAMRYHGGEEISPSSSKLITQSPKVTKTICKSLLIKLNLHKGRVRNHRLRILYWIQCGALPNNKPKQRLQYKLIPKELGNSECD